METLDEEKEYVSKHHNHHNRLHIHDQDPDIDPEAHPTWNQNITEEINNQYGDKPDGLHLDIIDTSSAGSLPALPVQHVPRYQMIHSNSNPRDGHPFNTHSMYEKGGFGTNTKDSEPATVPPTATATNTNVFVSGLAVPATTAVAQDT